MINHTAGKPSHSNFFLLFFSHTIILLNVFPSNMLLLYRYYINWHNFNFCDLQPMKIVKHKKIIFRLNVLNINYFPKFRKQIYFYYVYI